MTVKLLYYIDDKTKRVLLIKPSIAGVFKRFHSPQL